MSSFGQRLHALREAFGYSQEQLGQMLGCSRVAVSQWEADQTVPTWDKLDVLVEHFTVPHAWLMHGKGNPPSGFPRCIAPRESEDFLMAWTPKRAARLGWLAGRGMSMESVLRDRQVGAISEQSLRHTATRWGLHFGNVEAPAKAPLLSIPVPPGDQEILDQAAAARGLSTASFAATLIHVIASERLFAAVMDDDR